MINQIKLPQLKNTAKDISDRLNYLMAQTGVDGAQLSKATGVPVTTINRLRSGSAENNPTLSTLSPLASYFSVSVSQLIGDEPLNDNHSPRNKHLNQTIQLFPILSWSECINFESFMATLTTDNWENWTVGESLSANSFALSTKPSMEPRFPRGTVLFVNPDCKASDGNIVVVHYPNTQEATLRELSFDGPFSLLKSINIGNSVPDNLTSEIKILGVVSRTVFSFE
jgi:SOS-response transcriptional repressor LexA